MIGIYLVGNTKLGWYKVGLSNNIDKRHKDLQAGVPFPLAKFSEVPCPQRFLHEVERRVLRAFYQHRISGEWFTLPEYTVATFMSFVLHTKHEVKVDDCTNHYRRCLPETVECTITSASVYLQAYEKVTAELNRLATWQVQVSSTT
jgi:hypothetical protein